MGSHCFKGRLGHAMIEVKLFFWAKNGPKYNDNALK